MMLLHKQKNLLRFAFLMKYRQGGNMKSQFFFTREYSNSINKFNKKMSG